MLNKNKNIFLKIDHHSRIIQKIKFNKKYLYIYNSVLELLKHSTNKKQYSFTL